ncbi:hypothetical protein CLOP_g11753 [Closterium sp. NIES-67]|nr:hypothetical protein CLOP_g11753 [Closterium sp. NIES-67]
MAGGEEKAVEKAGDADVDMAEGPDLGKSDSDLDDGGNGEKEDMEDSDKDDSEDDDSEDEAKEAAEEAERKALIGEVKGRIASNPYDYQAHVQLIALLRRSSMLEELRAAREAMNALYPLSPAMWQQWAHDETSLIASDADVAKVEALYQRGVEEYVSPSLWQAYLSFLTAHHPAITTRTPEGLKLFRGTAEQALTQAGLHLGEGASVWGTYRGLEMEVLINVRKGEEEGKGGLGEEERTKQATRVRALFHRQLAVPHLQLPATLAAYLAWEEKEGGEKLPADPPPPSSAASPSSPDAQKLPGSVKAAYLKAEKMGGEGGAGGGSGGGAVATFDKSDELMLAYTEYLALEAASGDMPRQQAMHERMVTALPVVFDVWLKYIDLVDHKLKVPSVVRSVYFRAARNCPWVGSLWTRYLLALERLGAADADMAEVFEKALVSGVQSADEYFDIFLTRLDGLRRHLLPPESSKGALKGASLSEDERSKLKDTLRATFERASAFMASYFPDHQQALLQLAGYQAHIEAHLAGAAGATGMVGEGGAAGRGVWEQFVKKH